MNRILKLYERSFVPWIVLAKLVGDIARSGGRMAGAGINAPGWDYAPITSWFSPTISFSGNPRVEQEIYSEIASPGRQLGILSEALLEVADNEPDKKSLARLRTMVDEINKLKGPI